MRRSGNSAFVALLSVAVLDLLGLGLDAGQNLHEGAGRLCFGRRWFWLGLNAGTLLGAAFCMWLMTQALYEIGALCLWCCLAWAATIATSVALSAAQSG